MSLYRDNGIVLRTIRLGEADRIVTFVTAAHGKVRAVAKGVRKTKSKFGARLEPMHHVSLQLYEGRELDIVTQAETIDGFRNIREDLDRMGHATPLLEAIDQVAQEGETNTRHYQMLLGALRSLETRDSMTIVSAFFFRLLASEGLRPEVERCVVCGSEDGLVAFDLDEGGVLCRSDRRGTSVSPGSIALMRRMLHGRLQNALAEEPSAVVHEVEALATRLMEHHLERRLRSVHVLERR